MSDENLKVVRVMDAVSVAAAGTVVRVIDLSTLPIGNWAFTYQVKVTGDGTVAITYKHSLDGVNFVAVEAANSVVATADTSAVVFGSWAEAPLTAKWIEFTVTETVESDAAVVTFDIGVR